MPSRLVSLLLLFSQTYTNTGAGQGRGKSKEKRNDESKDESNYPVGAGENVDAVAVIGPEVVVDAVGERAEDSSLVLTETENLLFKLLTGMCGHSCCVQELINQQGLKILFDMLVDTNVPQAFRSRLAEIHTTVGQHYASSKAIVKYVHTYGCIRLLVEQLSVKQEDIKTFMSRPDRAAVDNLVLRALDVICINLKASSQCSALLCTDFSRTNSYTAFLEYVLWRFSDNSPLYPEEEALSTKLLTFIEELIFVGLADVKVDRRQPDIPFEFPPRSRVFAAPV